MESKVFAKHVKQFVPRSLMARILCFHLSDPGSIPGVEVFLFLGLPVSTATRTPPAEPLKRPGGAVS